MEGAKKEEVPPEEEKEVKLTKAELALLEPDYIEPRMVAKYELIAQVGKGSYGVVWRAIEKKNREVVAIKKIYDAFSNEIDAKRTYREIFYLCELVNHPNIMKVLRMYKSINGKDIYIVAEFIENDLHSVIRANICEDLQRKYIIWQLLKALKYMHSANVIHRDVKPSNILINRDCLVKLADFSLARSIVFDENNLANLSDYVAARWYRAPEILLGSSKYDYSVDMWSVGCILAELYLCRPLFPGSSTLNQISRIVEITGKPTAEDLGEIHSPVARTMFENLKLDRGEKRDLRMIMPPDAPEEAIDLIENLLQFRPSMRLTADEALEHPFVDRYHNGKEEKEYVGEIEFKLDDNKTFEIHTYQKELYRYIKKKNKQFKDERDQLITIYAKYKNSA